ncbi:MAG: NUDIX domain-containing protein [Rhodobacteraceae bacterium]|nr:NUDIX domain-containing protein [Paracoccaceae bacterium]
MSAPRLAVRAVLVHRDALLLVNAFPDGKSDLWCTPGGGVEAGESLTANLHREVFEETGLRIRIGGLCHVSEFQNAATGFHQVEMFFHAEADTVPASFDWQDPTGVVTARRFFRQGDLQGVRFKPDILPELAFGPPRPVLTPGALVPMAR